MPTPMNWYYAVGGAQKGPVTPEEFLRLVADGTIQPSTLVWREGLPDWRAYETIATNPPPAPPSSGAFGAPDAAGGATTGPVPLSFTGDSNEYFKIWIVNLLLTVVTFGIYAAWAKVRTKRYFYANTRLMGHAFEYLADPTKILVGNIIVVALFLSMHFASAVSVVAYAILVVVLLIATPWFVVRALTFNSRNSAWRGLRFHFKGRYGEAFCVFVLYPLLVPLSLGFAFPWVAKQQREWIVNRHAYGTTDFQFSGEVGEFYKIYLTGFAMMLPLVVCYGVLIGGLVAGQRSGRALPPEFAFVGLLIIPAFLLAYVGFFFVRVRLFNYAWTNTRIGANRFRGTMTFWDYFGIQISNALVTGITFGLMYPWAAVRLAKYTAASLRVVPGGNMDEFVGAAQPEVGAIGEAASDIFDLDIGIDFGL